MEQNNLSRSGIHRASKSGFFSFLFRNVFINILKIISVYFMAKWLEPKEFGIFAVLHGFIGVSFYFTDIGLSSALIQKTEDPSERELSSSAFVNIFLGVSIATIFWVIAPAVSAKYGFSTEGVMLLRVLGICIPLQVFRAVPSIILNRSLSFKKIAFIESIETFIMYLTQITLAYLGYGVWSFVFAFMSRAITGSVLMIYFTGFYPLPIFRLDSVRPHLKFALPFQATSLLSGLKGLVIPLILGALLEVRDVGYVSWTYGIVSIPLALTIIYNTVVFPSLSKMKEDEKAVTHMASRGLELSVLGMFIIFGIMYTTYESGIKLIFDPKWYGAEFLFPFAISFMFLHCIRFTCISLLNSLGKSMGAFKLEVVSLVLSFLLSYILVSKLGAIGFYIASATIELLVLILTFVYIRNYLNIRIYKRIFILLCIFASIVLMMNYLDFGNFFIELVFFLLTFCILSVLFSKEVLKDFIWLKNEIFSKLLSRT